MKTFGDFTAQLRDNFGAMPLQSKVIAAMLLAVIVIGLGLLVQSGSETSKQYLFGGRTISDEEMRKVEVAFGTAGLRDYEFIGSRVKVPSATSDAYLRALSDGEAVPAGQSEAINQILENSNVFEPSGTLDKKLMKGKELDLASRIMQFPEVRSATVFYDSKRLGFSSQNQQSASVIVTPYGNEALSAYTKKEIAALVQAAYAGMNVQDVRVTDTNMRGRNGDPWVDENDPYYRTKRQYEIAWEEKIRFALADYGPPKVVVDVELDPNLLTDSMEVTYDPNAVGREESSTSKSVESTKSAGGGVPGVASNAYPGNSAVRLEDEIKNKETETTESTSKAIGSTHTQTKLAGLVPKKTSVLISLRESFYSDVIRTRWLARNPGKNLEDAPDPSPGEIEGLRTETKSEITEAITTIIPALRAGDDTSPLVKVLDYPDLPVSETVTPVSSSNATAWLANSWQSIALVFVSIIALFVARGALKAPPGPPTPDFASGFGLEIPAPQPDELAISESEEAEGQGVSMELTGTNLKEELNSVIEMNPDAAANVIRAWLSDAA